MVCCRCAARARGVDRFATLPLEIRIDGTPSLETRALRRAALLSPWPWTLVTTGAPDRVVPQAKLIWGGSQRVVTDPAEMTDAVRDLTGPQ